jgi:hypothetical protein
LTEIATDRCGPVAAIARQADVIVGGDLSFICGNRMHNYQGG